MSDLLIGRTIRVCRSARGMSQGEMADAAGLGQSMVSLIERGARNPSIRTLEDLARALHLSPLHLLLLADDEELRRCSPEMAKALLLQVLGVED